MWHGDCFSQDKEVSMKTNTTQGMPIIKAAPPVPPKKELVPMELFVTMHQYVEEGVREGQSQDYVTDRILKLSQENPEASKAMEVPGDVQGIKKTIVAPFYSEQKKEAPKKSEENQGYQFSETADCLLDEANNILTSSVLCVTSAVGKQWGKVAVSCGSAIAETASCVKEGFGK